MQIREKHKQAKIEAKASKKKRDGKKSQLRKRDERRIPAENGASEIEQKDRRTKDKSEILHKMILGPNTLKTPFGPIILFFVTLSHGLRYVLEKPILIKHEY